MDPANTVQMAEFMNAYLLRGQHAPDRALTRYKYDTCKMVENNEITTGPGRYRLGVPNAYGNAVFAPNPTVRQQKWGASHDMTSTKTDVESDLRNIARPTTRSACGQYQPEEGAAVAQRLTAMPEEVFPMTFARLVDPPCTGRATGWNRWAWLGEDPQANVMVPFEHLVDSRAAAKDGVYSALNATVQPLEASPLVASRQLLCSKTYVPPAIPVPRSQPAGAPTSFSDTIPGSSQRAAGIHPPPAAQFTPRGAPEQGAGHPDAPPRAPPSNRMERQFAQTGVLEAPAPFSAFIAPH